MKTYREWNAFVERIERHLAKYPLSLPKNLGLAQLINGVEDSVLQDNFRGSKKEFMEFRSSEPRRELYLSHRTQENIRDLCKWISDNVSGVDVLFL